MGDIENAAVSRYVAFCYINETDFVSEETGWSKMKDC